MTKRISQTSDHYERIANAISFLQQNVENQPSLAETASHIGLSTYHFQRLFREWAGVSPKRFLEYLTVNHAKRMLDDSKSILDTSLELGLSSPARLHDQFVSIEAITPGQYKLLGKDMEIRYGIHPSPFGEMFLAHTEKGICKIAFVNGTSQSDEISSLKKSWPNAAILEDKKSTSTLAQQIFQDKGKYKTKLMLAIRGTNFQINVWQALLKIPSAHITSYQTVADMLGRPQSVRATANAIALNPVAFLIPCHRVLRSSGAISGYRWGAERKQIMLAWEMAKNA